MESATITSKGQVTIPIATRKDMGLIPGSKLDFICDADGSWRIVKRKRSIMDIAATLKYSGDTISVEDMKKAAKKHVVKTFKIGLD